MKNLYIFDCFGVVVSDVSTLWMNRHFTAEQQAFARKEVFRKVDCGQMSFDDSFEILAKMCGITKEAARAEWDDCLYPLQETLPLLWQLKQQGGTVALLSNASKPYIDEIFARYDLHKYFDKVFVSSCYGCAKPDREFYQLCLDSFCERFDNVYFTDDNPANLKELQSLGITPLLFTSALQLKKDLDLK